MSKISSGSLSIVFLALALAGGIIAAYYYIAENVDFIIFGTGAAVLFLICFFNVRLSLILLSMSMLLSPELAIGSTTSRDITIRLDDIILLVMTLSWFVRIAVLKDVVGLMLKNPLNGPIAFYSVIMIISTALGAYFGNVKPLAGFFFVAKIIEYFFLYSVIVNFIRDQREVDILLNVMFGVCAVICLYALSQVAIGKEASAPFEGGIGERNTLGGYLVLVGAVAAGVQMYTTSRIEKWMLLCLIVLIMITLVYSLSRSSWIAALTVLFMLLFSIKERRMYIAVIVCLLMATPFLLPESAIQRFKYTFSEGSSYYSRDQVRIGTIALDTSTSARLLSYQYILKQIWRHPLLGFGVTGFGFIDGQYFRILIELGIIGFLSFVWLYFKLFQVLRQALKLELTPRNRGLTVGFHAAFWGMLVHAASANTFIIVRIAEPFWYFAGLTVLSMLNSKLHVSPENQPEQIEEKPRHSYHTMPGSRGRFV